VDTCEDAQEATRDPDEDRYSRQERVPARLVLDGFRDRRSDQCAHPGGFAEALGRPAHHFGDDPERADHDEREREQEEEQTVGERTCENAAADPGVALDDVERHPDQRDGLAPVLGARARLAGGGLGPRR